MDDKIKLLEDTGHIFKSFSDWASPICIMKKPNPSHHKSPSFGCV